MAIPGAVLRWLDSDLQLQLDYGARGFWRVPNELGKDRPLLLHMAHASLFDRLAPHLSLTGQAQASVGEADYSALPILFSGPQSSLPAVIDVLSLSTGFGLTWDASARWRLEVAADAERRQTLGDSPTTTDANGVAVPGLTLPRQTSLRETTALGVRPTRRDLVGLAVVGAFAKYDSFPVLGVTLLTVAPQAFWRRQLSRQTELRAAFGASIARRWGEPVGAVLVQEPLTVTPTFTLLAESRVAHVDGQSWEVGGGFTGDSFLDPVLAVVTPRVVALAHVWWRAPPKWQAGLEGSFVAPLSKNPLPGYPDETAFSVTLPVRYRVSPHWGWEWGLRWSDRAPHWDAAEFHFHQRQLWIYCSILAETANLFE